MTDTFLPPQGDWTSVMELPQSSYVSATISKNISMASMMEELMTQRRRRWMMAVIKCLMLLSRRNSLRLVVVFTHQNNANELMRCATHAGQVSGARCRQMITSIPLNQICSIIHRFIADSRQSTADSQQSTVHSLWSFRNRPQTVFFAQ